MAAMEAHARAEAPEALQAPDSPARPLPHWVPPAGAPLRLLVVLCDRADRNGSRVAAKRDKKRGKAVRKERARPAAAPPLDAPRSSPMQKIKETELARIRKEEGRGGGGGGGEDRRDERVWTHVAVGGAGASIAARQPGGGTAGTAGTAGSGAAGAAEAGRRQRDVFIEALLGHACTRMRVRACAQGSAFLPLAIKQGGDLQRAVAASRAGVGAGDASESESESDSENGPNAMRGLEDAVLDVEWSWDDGSTRRLFVRVRSAEAVAAAAARDAGRRRAAACTYLGRRSCDRAWGKADPDRVIVAFDTASTASFGEARNLVATVLPMAYELSHGADDDTEAVLAARRQTITYGEVATRVAEPMTAARRKQRDAMRARTDKLIREQRARREQQRPATLRGKNEGKHRTHMAAGDPDGAVPRPPSQVSLVAVGAHVDAPLIILPSALHEVLTKYVVAGSCRFIAPDSAVSAVRDLFASFYDRRDLSARPPGTDPTEYQNTLSSHLYVNDFRQEPFMEPLPHELPPTVEPFEVSIADYDVSCAGRWPTLPFHVADV